MVPGVINNVTLEASHVKSYAIVLHYVAWGIIFLAGIHLAAYYVGQFVALANNDTSKIDKLKDFWMNVLLHLLCMTLAMIVFM